jgi:hypothetical protein
VKITIATFIGLALLVTIGPAFAKSAEPSVAPSAQVVDSTGKIVGPYFPVTPAGQLISDAVLLQIKNASLLILVNPAGFPSENAQNDALIYADANCSGVPYMPLPNATSTPLNNPGALVVSPEWSVVFNGVLFYPTLGETPQPFSSGSYQVPGTTTCLPLTNPNGLFVPATTFNLSTLGFVPPFRIMHK